MSDMDRLSPSSDASDQAAFGEFIRPDFRVASSAEVLIGRFAFTPREGEDGRFSEFAGQVSISTLLTGMVLPKVWWPQRDLPPRGPIPAVPF